MKIFLLTLYLVISLAVSGQGQVSQFPQVYYNNQVLNIRPSASLNNTPISSLTASSKIGAVSLELSTEVNGTASWAKVCLPSTTGNIKYGYMMYGSDYLRINELNNYATVTASSLYIRPCAGCTTENVTIGGANAFYGQNSIVALTGNSSSGWYEVYLTTDCSQNTGWLSGTYLTINSNTNNYYNIAGTVLNTGSVNIWGATVTMGSYSTSSTEGFYQYKLPISWTGTITCTHSSYNTTTPVSYSYTASGHDYTKNFVLSNVTPCTNSTAPSSASANPTTISSGSSSTLTQNGGTLGSCGSWYWYSGSCGETYVGSDNSISVSPSTTTTYYVRAEGGNITSCQTTGVTVTVTSGCTAPTISDPTDKTVSSGSNTSFSVTATGGTTPYSFKWQYNTGSSWADVPNTSPYSEVDSYTLSINSTTTSMDGYKYRCVVSSGGSCSSYSAPSNYATLNVNSYPATISVNSQTVQPWQRANEASIVVSANCTTSDNTTWRIKATNPNDGTIAYSTYYSSGNTGNWTVPVSFYPNPTEPLGITYSVVSNSGATNTISGSTKIINKKLDSETVVYYNDETDGDKILIPVNYTSTYYNNISNMSVEIERKNKTSRKGESLPDNFIEPITIINLSSNNIFSIGLDGYCKIYAGNSNLISVYPGEFIYKTYYGATLIETDTFSLVKIGKIKDNSPSTKVAVIIGGIGNTIENNVNFIKANHQSASSQSSDISFSLVAYLGTNTSFNTWYISQGNFNSVRRNGYDIGVALERIQEITGTNEIAIISHSKGGLDTRAFLQNWSLSLRGFSKNYNTSSVNGIIKKVLFLATPHRGSSIGLLYAWWGQSIVSSIGNNLPQGVYDLMSIGINNPTHILSLLDNSPIPSNISYANLTCYKTWIDSYFSYQTFSIQYQYINDFSDGIVEGWSSDGIYFYDINNNYIPVKQLYQESEKNGRQPHSEIHKNMGLSKVTSSTFANLNCIYSPYTSNLDKILAFMVGSSPYNLNTPFSSCTQPSMSSISIQSTASILSGAHVYRKIADENQFNKMGITGETGEFNGTIIPAFQVGDSIKIEASGYETLIISVDSDIISTGKIEVSMLKSITTNKIQYPALSIVNQEPITANSTISLKATGINVLNYKINNPVNQDSIFVPLNLSNNMFTAQLDTGYNRILVTFIGSHDTVTLAKEIYYLPDTLMNYFTYNLSVISDSSSIGTKVYANNQFVKEITDTNTTIPLLQGQNSLKFIKFGYEDKMLTINKDTSIVLALQLIDYSYSKPFDSSIVNFPVQGKIQYRRNITVMDSSQKSIISLRQFDEDFSNKALIPKSRSFELRHLNPPNWSTIKFAVALDQKENISNNNIYLMNIKGDSVYTKLPIDSVGLCEYDSVVQKLLYTKIDFGQGNYNTEKLVIMKKQPPKQLLPAITILKDSTLVIKLTDIFADPDSIKGDFSIELLTLTPPNVNLTRNGDTLILKGVSGFIGNSSISIKAIHDFITIVKTIPIYIVSPCSIPMAPTNLTATANSTSQITLNWSDKSNNETGFEIERSLNPTSGFSNIKTVNANTISYIDPLLSANTKYYYQVRACCSSFCSNYVTANATTLSAMPTCSLTLSSDSTNIDYNENTKFIEINTTCEWSADRFSNWVGILPKNNNYPNKLSFLIKENLSCEQRIDSIIITTVSDTVYYKVIQNGVNNEPVAGFLADKTFGHAPLYVQFTDTSHCKPTSWFWTFYGATPSTSSLETVNVLYDKPGNFSVKLIASNKNGTSEHLEPSYISVLHGHADNTKLDLFPNPNNKNFTLKLLSTPLSDYKIAIYNLIGEEIYSSTIDNTTGEYSKEINLETTPSGIYYLHLTNENESIVRKIIIEK